MNRTKIEWVRNPDGTPGYTWNPITGCLNHDDGLCKGGDFPCFAYTLAHGRLKSRYMANMNVAPRKINARTFPRYDPFYPRLWEDRLFQPMNDKHISQKGIFPCSMSDLFGIGIPEEWTKAIMDVIEDCPTDRFYLLTKQPQNLAKFSPFPDNCWPGVTATDYYAMFKALNALAYLDGGIQAKVKFVSFEPLLESVAGPRLNLSGIKWVIIGAQTKPYKPPKIEWVEEIVRACDEAGVAVFIKNNLEPLLFKSDNHDLFWEDLANLRQELPK